MFFVCGFESFVKNLLVVITAWAKCKCFQDVARVNKFNEKGNGSVIADNVVIEGH